MGPLIKTNRAHQEGAPEDQSGQSLLIYRRPDQTYRILSGRLRDNVRLLFAKSEFSSLRKKKETPAAALNQRSHPETLDKHTAPAFLSGPVGLWGREVCA